MMLCVAHLVVSDQKQAHQRGVEDRLGDVCCLSLQAVLRHQGPTQALTRVLHVDTTGPWHPILLQISEESPKKDPEIDSKCSHRKERLEVCMTQTMSRFHHLSSFTWRGIGEQSSMVIHELSDREESSSFKE